MKKETDTNEDDDDTRAEYDFSQMKFVGRGIYAERYRKGVTFVFLDEEQITAEHTLKEHEKE